MLVPVREALPPVVDTDPGIGEQVRAASWPVISQGVVPFQIRTRESGFCAPISSIACGGANGQRASRSIGYSGGMSAETCSAARVSDMGSPSFLDVDGQGGGACGRGLTGHFGVLGSGLGDQ